MTHKDIKAEDVTIGSHPDGYQIDKTASPMDRYTRWTIQPDGTWSDPKPVCFHSLPPDRWNHTAKE